MSTKPVMGEHVFFFLLSHLYLSKYRAYHDIAYNSDTSASLLAFKISIFDTFDSHNFGIYVSNAHSKHSKTLL